MGKGRTPTARIEVVLEDVRKDGCMRVTSGVIADLTDHLQETTLAYLDEHDLTAARTSVDSTYGYEVTRAQSSAKRRATG